LGVMLKCSVYFEQENSLPKDFQINGQELRNGPHSFRNKRKQFLVFRLHQR
jgi:hypothetical protein